jgi:hypothetical protein
MIENTEELKARVALRVDKLFTDGMLMDLNIYKWPALCRLTAIDLKIDEPIPAFFKLGNKQLIKQQHISKFTSLENKARDYLDRKSFKFPIAQAHFVPMDLFDEVYKQLDTYKTDYYAAVGQFIANYETYKIEMVSEFPDYADALLAAYPSVEYIQNKFSFSFVPFKIALPEVVEVDVSQLKAQEAAQILLQNQIAEEFQQRCSSFVNEAVTSLRGKIIDTFTVIGEKIRNREVINKTNVMSMMQVMKTFEDLDFTNDNVINTRLQEVKDLLETTNSFKSNQEAVDALNIAVNSVLDAARSTTDIDTVTGNYLRNIAV